MEDSKSEEHSSKESSALLLPLVSNEGRAVPPLTSSTDEAAPVFSSSSATVTSISASYASNSSSQHTKLPEPPPLIAMSSLTSASFLLEAPPNLNTEAESLEKEKPQLANQKQSLGSEEKPSIPSLITLDSSAASPPATVQQKTPATDSTSSLEAPNKLETLGKKSPKVSSVNVGGLGAGKPKAFLAMMNTASSTTPKKQTKKVDSSGGSGSGGRGQGSKHRSPLSGSSTKKNAAEVVPSRSSNRNIKRPRTYEEEMDDLRAAAKASATKKTKITSKVGGVWEGESKGGRGDKTV